MAETRGPTKEMTLYDLLGISNPEEEQQPPPSTAAPEISSLRMPAPIGIPSVSTAPRVGVPDRSTPFMAPGASLTNAVFPTVQQQVGRRPVSSVLPSVELPKSGPAPLTPSMGMMSPQDRSEGQAAGGPVAAPRSRLDRFGHIVGEVGKDVGVAAGSMLLPAVMPWIPGTPQHQRMEENAQKRRDEADIAKREGEARIGQIGAQTGEEQAVTRQRGLESDALGRRAKDIADYMAAHPNASQLDAEKAVESALSPTSVEKPMTVKPGESIYDPTTGKFTTVPGTTPEAFERSEIVGPDGKPMLANYDRAKGKYFDLNGNEIAGAKPYQKEPNEPKPTAGMVGGKPAWGQYVQGKGWLDPNTGQPIPGFQPPPSFAETGLYEPTEVNVGGKLQPGKFDRRTGNITVANVAGGGPVAIPHAVEGEINKIMDTARGADTRYGVMIDNEKPALAGNQQAMINILANHMGMTQGLQKGSRINQAMWDEATASAPWIDRVLSRFTKVDPQTGERVITGPLSGITLTPDQIKQMVDLGQDRRVREWQQAAHTAAQNGLDISGEIPQDVREGIAKAEGTAGSAGPKTPAAPKKYGNVTFTPGE